jgi:hypothetical protein
MGGYEMIVHDLNKFSNVKNLGSLGVPVIKIFRTRI